MLAATRLLYARTTPAESSPSYYNKISRGIITVTRRPLESSSNRGSRVELNRTIRPSASQQQFQRHQTTLWVNLTMYNSMSRYQLNSSSQNKTSDKVGEAGKAGKTGEVGEVSAWRLAHAASLSPALPTSSRNCHKLQGARRQRTHTHSPWPALRPDLTACRGYVDTATRSCGRCGRKSPNLLSHVRPVSTTLTHDGYS